jgi:haloalkane dehalogenase
MTFDITPYRDEYPWEGKRFDVPGGSMHYLDVGDGEPVLMLHGNPTWSFYWRRLVRALSPERRCIVPDHMGMGLSDKPGDDAYQYTLDRRVDDIEALVDSLGVSEGLTVIAHDWGGMIGLAYAARRPERIARLVLMNTSGFPLPQGSSLPWQLQLVKRLPFAIPVRGLNLFVQGAARTCTVRPGSMPPQVRKAYVAPYDSWANRIAIHRFVQDIPLGPGDPAWTTTVRVSEALTELAERPMLIVWGERDFVFNDAFLSEWRRRLPGVEYLTFADAGHYVLEDAAAEVVPAVVDFLARHPLMEKPS